MSLKKTKTILLLPTMYVTLLCIFLPVQVMATFIAKNISRCFKSYIGSGKKYGSAAVFEALASSPAGTEASRFADAYGMMETDGEEHVVEQADAEQAYTQAWLTGTETWVRLPYDQWPQKWKDDKMVDPVCPLVLALYGHPDSGTDWEVYSQTHVMSCGFMPIDGWPSCFWHADLQLFLVIYVDDFKMSGPKCNLAKGWELIGNGLKIEPPTPLGLYLGCKHEQSTRTLPDTGKSVRVIEYNMEEFLSSCVDKREFALRLMWLQLQQVFQPNSKAF